MSSNLRPESVRRPGLISRGTAILLASTMLFSGQAFAQESTEPPQDETTIAERFGEEIVVTARRRDESLQSVPISITAVSDEVLEDFRIEDIDNLQDLDPSFSVSASSGRPNAPVYALRGIRPTEAIYGQDPTVAIYLADVVLSPAQGSNLGFYDLENIQILKGPQGTLFGRNTIGGAILLTPRKPGSVFSGEAMVGVGSYGLVETQLGVDIPLADTFQVRIAGRTIDGGDYQTNVIPGPLNGTELGGQTTRSVRVTAVGELSPDITNTTVAMYDNKKTNGRGTTLIAVNPAHPRAGAIPEFFDALARAQNRPITDVESDMDQKDNVEAWGIINTTEAQLADDLTFKFIGAYREVDTEVVFDLDASSLVGILTSEQEADLNHMSLEAQFLGTSFDGRLDWVIGGYYYQENGTEFSPGGFFGGTIYQSGEVRNKSYSAFAQGSFRITPELSLTGGVRFNRDEKEMTLSQTYNGVLCLLQVDDGTGTGGLVRLPLDNCHVDLKDSFSQPTGTVSLDYQITPDVLVYLASRLGYRSGGFNLRGSQPVQYQPFEPETVTDIEFGTKADWYVGDVAMRTNLAIFYQQYDDIQRTVAVATPLGSPASVVVNAASAHVFSIELQQQIRPTENLTLQINYAYNDPAYQEWMDPASGNDLSSTPFYFTPTHSGNAMLTFEQPLPGGMGTLRFGANAAYTGETWINALHTSDTIAQQPASVLPLLKQESYWLLDFTVGWDGIAGSDFDLSLYMKNATDTVYKVGGVQLYTGASGFISAAYGEPRTYGAQLRMRF
ncbi:TonB-dependent receptor [Stakelama tenebrarum]|uniref:TonB-dependent receptor n=1 Tax=Stakelama tenebrarum TaxID=2711215 RepID=A0A6G6Y7T8_9SPHN|nr:TonB-dependent receptor [Sphingosinithalassobacter tenebrarum]QIG80980.1 TonB-dependent receptor [Sphingosinithalassobacter tenebrarum]